MLWLVLSLDLSLLSVAMFLSFGVSLQTLSVAHFLFYPPWSFPCLSIDASLCLIFSLCVFFLPSLFLPVGSVLTFRPHHLLFLTSATYVAAHGPGGSSLHLNCLEAEP